LSLLSHRFQVQELNENRLSSIIHNKKNNRINYLDLTISNPTQLNLSIEINSLLTKLDRIDYNPNPRGDKESIESLIRFYNKKGRILSEKEIFFTTGSSESLSRILSLFFNKDDILLLPKPGYPLYDYILNFHDINYNHFEFELIKKNNKSKWKLNKDSLNFTQNTKAILIVQPNNPAGFILQEEDADYISDLAYKNNSLIIIDEVFSDYYTNYYTYHFFKKNNCIYLGGLSKTAALPQLKLSWMLFKGDTHFIQESGLAMEFLLDSYLSVNTLSLKLLPLVLETIEERISLIQNRINANLDLLQNQLNLNSLIPEGGWYIPIELPEDLDDEDFSCKLLEEENVLVQPGYFFDLKNNFIVLSLLSDINVLKEGINRMNRFIKK
jgi:aspartate/methionine/tyrosine aminotransferase